MKCPSFVHENKVLPSFYRVVMAYPHNGLSDVEKAVNEALDRVMDCCGIMPGQTVAVGVGSRNITSLPVMVRTLCRRIKALGAVPMIIPAMGSHGGAEAKGQANVLERLGITKESCGSDIVSSMDAVHIGSVFDDVPVYYSKDGLAMDHSVVINRIKPHTKFKGDVESGIYKMMCVGMGKHLGASAIHKAALRHGFFPVIKEAGDTVIRHSNFRFALGVVENQHDEPVEIKAVLAGDLFNEEKRMLKLSKSLFPRLPFRNLDALVIRKIGKDISGSGMDPNVTGRAYDLMEDDFSPNLSVTRIALLDLSDQSDGNAIGLGNADIITEKLYNKMDYSKTLVNALTSTSLRKAFIPICMDDDESAIRAAFSTCGVKHMDRLRAVIIQDTRHVREFWASSALVEELVMNPEAVLHEEAVIMFTEQGDLILG